MNLSAGGYLTFYMPDRRSFLDMSISKPTSLKSLLQEVGIPLDEVHLAIVNDEIVSLDEAVVGNQDRVKVYSPIDGG